MAHRKVLSSEAPVAGDSACLSSCYSCPSYCGSYCCYVPPSPPPPVSPDCSPAPSPMTVLNGGGGSSALPAPVIVVIALLGGIFLLVSYYVIIAKSCLICRRRGRSRGHPPPDGGEGGGGWAEEFMEEGRVDHPVWYIRTVGLSPAAISSIAVYEYRKGEGLVEGSDCTVCLSEFSDGESLRVLPKCGHAFHVPCIDAWLRSHTNCPLCRAAIVVPVQLPLPPPERLSQRLDGGGGGGGDRAAGAVVGGGENSNGAGAGEGVEPGEPNGGGLPKEIEEVSGQNGQLGLVVEEEEEGVVRVRRSFSVDSPFLAIELPGGSEPESSDANTSEARPIDESQSSADRAGTSSRPAARSQSWSGRLFMPRPNSNTRNSSNSNLSR